MLRLDTLGANYLAVNLSSDSVRGSSGACNLKGGAVAIGKVALLA